jgi:hypothetical protein
LAWLLRKYYSNKIDQHPTLTLKTKSKFYRRFAYYSFSSRRELQVKKEWQSMRIGEEIIKMLRQKRDKQAAGKAKEREANSLEAGPPPAEESFSTINLVKTEESGWIAEPALSGEMLRGRQLIAGNLL